MKSVALQTVWVVGVVAAAIVLAPLSVPLVGVAFIILSVRETRRRPR